MTDILIRSVPDGIIREIDRRARQIGVSRSEFLRRWVSGEFQPEGTVTTDDLLRFEQLAQDLNDPDVMGQAWS